MIDADPNVLFHQTHQLSLTDPDNFYEQLDPMIMNTLILNDI